MSDVAEQIADTLWEDITLIRHKFPKVAARLEPFIAASVRVMEDQLTEITRLRALNEELVTACKAARHQLRHGAPHLMTPVDDVVQQIDAAIAAAQAAYNPTTNT